MPKNKSGANKFVTVSESETDIVRAMPISGGILLKSITLLKGKVVAESTVELAGGVLVNHGTEEEPDWKLNR